MKAQKIGDLPAIEVYKMMYVKVRHEQRKARIQEKLLEELKDNG